MFVWICKCICEASKAAQPLVYGTSMTHPLCECGERERKKQKMCIHKVFLRGMRVLAD